MRDFIIRLLGGYTEKEVSRAIEAVQQRQLEAMFQQSIELAALKAQARLFGTVGEAMMKKEPFMCGDYMYRPIHRGDK